MTRIKVILPDHFIFSTTIAVRITDVNYGGHVGNDAILGILHEARIQFLQHHGYRELDFEGIGLIMSDVIIEFKKELFYGDVIQASVAAKNFSRIGFDIFYKLEVQAAGKLSVVAVAKTGMVCFDYTRKKNNRSAGKGQAENGSLRLISMPFI